MFTLCSELNWISFWVIDWNSTKKKSIVIERDFGWTINPTVIDITVIVQICSGSLHSFLCISIVSCWSSSLSSRKQGDFRRFNCKYLCINRMKYIFASHSKSHSNPHFHSTRINHMQLVAVMVEWKKGNLITFWKNLSEWHGMKRQQWRWRWRCWRPNV